ncbi:hypothetical protein F5880DRAFT_1470073 [Lentinula raphanica]|nr:hypothetical protein F5880DRAFT_1470073 [Lentinula raphanica]
MIQRPRNRQGRKRHPNQTNTDQKSTRSYRAAGSVSTNTSNPSLPVPTVRQVVSGAYVSIVLKIDQPTGRQVQGIVAEVLTSGDHPRGIKVRLVDGRVGRVQRMVTEMEARAGSVGLSDLGRNGDTHVQHISRPAIRTDRTRLDTQHNLQEESGTRTPLQFNLGDFLPHDLSPPIKESEEFDLSCFNQISHVTLHTCPVCYEFEGDEIAVSHHVNSHFS